MGVPPEETAFADAMAEWHNLMKCCLYAFPGSTNTTSQVPPSPFSAPQFAQQTQSGKLQNSNLLQESATISHLLPVAVHHPPPLVGDWNSDRRSPQRFGMVGGPQDQFPVLQGNLDLDKDQDISDIKMDLDNMPSPWKAPSKPTVVAAHRGCWTLSAGHQCQIRIFISFFPSTYLTILGVIFGHTVTLTLAI